MSASTTVILLEAVLIVLFVSVSVVSLPTKVSVDVGNVIVPVLLIVEITGDVNVLFVNVCEPVNVATVLSIAIEIWSSLTVVSIPVPPANVNVLPVVNVSSEPLSAESVNVPAAALLKLKLPEPSVVKI